MTRRLRLSHLTRFEYATPVTHSHKLLRLTPRTLDRQRVHSSDIEIVPAPTVATECKDAYGNTLTEVFVDEEHRALSIHAVAEVDVSPTTPVDWDRSPPWDELAARMQVPWNNGAWEAVPFCFPSPRVALDGARDFAAPVFPPGTPVLQAAAALATRICSEIEYRGGVTDVLTSVADVLEAGQGVCQDFAHLAIACLRAHGLPARYVSGYVLTARDGGEHILNDRDGAEPGLTGGDASHAWFSVWCPTFGWVDIDPTNNLVIGDEHITLAWGRDYGDVSPTAGYIRGGGEQTLEVDVRVMQAK